MHLPLSRFFLAALLLVSLTCLARAQVDPEKRRLLHAGYDQNFSGAGPTGAYVFYYMNQPDFVRKKMNLRIALAPVYLDSELALRGALGENTDLGFGLAGGGFSDGYSEVRRGHFSRDESFRGNGAKVSASLYHLFNPNQLIPLNGILRVAVAGSTYERSRRTADSFELPVDNLNHFVRAGLRLGGAPPNLIPAQAAELSGWYETRWRKESGLYGFSHDRAVNPTSSFFWMRALFAYRTEEGRQFHAVLGAGASLNADRLDAYRLGGFLPFASEFPLSLPGYFNGEISASRYASMSLWYEQPVGGEKRLSVDVFSAAANVKYLTGMDQPNPWNEGVGGGVVYRPVSRVWKLGLDFAYGINAMRAGGRGAYSAILLLQLDLEAWYSRIAPKKPVTVVPEKPEGMDWFYEMFRP